MIHFETGIDGIDWTQAAEVFRRAPLGERNPDQLARAFRKSSAYVFAYDDASLIGLCRALCDGEYQAVIYDVVLLPEYQGRGIGREMFSRLRSQLNVPNILLYAVHGKEEFYQQFGFKRMLTAMAILHPHLTNRELGYLEDEPSQH